MGALANVRRYERYYLQTAVEIVSPSRSTSRVGFSDNVSAGGMLFRTASRFEVGDSLSIRFSLVGLGTESLVEARVVRAHPVTVSTTAVMPFATAVVFLAPQPELATYDPPTAP